MRWKVRKGEHSDEENDDDERSFTKLKRINYSKTKGETKNSTEKNDNEKKKEKKNTN